VSAAFADHAGDVFMGAPVFARKLFISARLLQRIEVCALHVFDDGELERLRVRRFDEHDRNVMQARPLRGAPAPLPRDDLIHVFRSTERAHHDGLDDAALLDGHGKLIELDIREVAARIARIGT
jgi:hypothetical protein